MILYRDKVDIDEQPSTPTLPGAGTLNLYADSAGLVAQDSVGATTDLTGQIYPERLVLWGVLSSDVLAFEKNAAFLPNPYSSQRHRFASYLNPSRAGEVFAYYVPLASGNYTMQVIGLEFSGSGVMVFSVDGDVIATRSMYDASAVFNVTYTLPFSIGRSGSHRIDISNLSSAPNATEDTYVILTKMIITKD